MYDITFRSDMTVDLIDSMGNDDSVIRSAKVSTMTASCLSRWTHFAGTDGWHSDQHG